MLVDPPSTDSRNHQDEPTYWFAVLEIARERGEFAAAAEAQRELGRLGVTVRYGRPPVTARAKKKGADHAS